MEEERRLFYVGITRAKDRLYLLRAIQRGGRGMSEETYPSRFLEDVPASLLVGKTRTGRPASSFSSSRSSYGSPSTSSSSWTLPPPLRSAPVAQPISKYKSGDRVKHASFGEGTVLESKILGADETVVIEFKSVGLKRLDASLAKLEII
jgi:DNA helicase-2/ATP-dependent DNA helicase PcrA